MTGLSKPGRPRAPGQLGRGRDGMIAAGMPHPVTSIPPPTTVANHPSMCQEGSMSPRAKQRQDTCCTKCPTGQFATNIFPRKACFAYPGLA